MKQSWRLALVAPVLVVGLAACAADTGVKVAAPLNLGGVTVAGSGVEAVRIDTTLSVDAAGASVKAPVTASLTTPVGGTSSAATGKVHAFGIDAELRIVDGTLYVGLPKLPLPKSWVKVAADKAGSKGGLGHLSALAAQLADAQELTGFLQQSGSVDKVGTDTIDGTAVDHFHATVDVAKALAGSSLPAGVTSAAGTMLGDSLAVDLWVDSHHVLRRLSYQLDLGRLAAGLPVGSLGLPSTGSLTVRLDIHDASKVDVQAPKASDTIDLATIAGFLPHLGQLFG